MQSDNKFFEDLTKVASSAMGTMFNMKKEIDTMVKENIERMLGKADIISRDEFEAIKEVATKARSAQSKLEKRVAELETKLKEKASNEKYSIRKKNSAKKVNLAKKKAK